MVMGLVAAFSALRLLVAVAAPDASSTSGGGDKTALLLGLAGDFVPLVAMVPHLAGLVVAARGGDGQGSPLGAESRGVVAPAALALLAYVVLTGVAFVDGLHFLHLAQVCVIER